MFLLQFLWEFFVRLPKIPHFVLYHIKDAFLYIKNRRWREFFGWGLHLFVGKFGAGKTATMVNKAYSIAKRYPQVTIVTNLKLSNFPKHTKILPLKTPQDILNAPDNCLVLIDEIGTIFNSRDFAKSKESVPKPVFQHLCQCRKRKLMIFGTVQRWVFLDKQLRDITDTVTLTRTVFRHPFGRLCTTYKYDAFQYDKAVENPAVQLFPLDIQCYVQSDKLRDSYDTQELITNMLKADYISDKEILENRGEVCGLVVDTAGAKKKKSRFEV